MRRKLTYDPRRDYYAILELDSSATSEDIRRAFRRSVRAVHPDLHPDRAAWATEQLQLINEAYDVLGEPARRRDYDRLRWLYVPRAQSAARAPRYSPPAYDPARPWWDQTTIHRPRSASSTTDTAPGPAYYRGQRSTGGNWLYTHGLGPLGPHWRTIVGLWRTPYAGLLTLLSALLVLNLAVIVYIFIGPDAGQGRLEIRFSDESSSLADVSLYRACLDPGLQIQIPQEFDMVGETFTVMGTVDQPEMWSYVIEIGYLGPSVFEIAGPVAWETARAPDPQQSAPEEPIQNDVLAEGVPLGSTRTGYYAVRLRILPIEGPAPEPCDVVVQH